MLRPKRWLTLATWLACKPTIDYNPDTGEIIVARCGGCHEPLYSHEDECQNLDCEYNQDEEEADDEDEE